MSSAQPKVTVASSDARAPASASASTPGTVISGATAAAEGGVVVVVDPKKKEQEPSGVASSAIAATGKSTGGDTTTNTNTATNSDNGGGMKAEEMSISDKTVLEYLRKHGLAQAESELQAFIHNKRQRQEGDGDGDETDKKNGSGNTESASSSGQHPAGVTSNQAKTGEADSANNHNKSKQVGVVGTATALVTTPQFETDEAARKAASATTVLSSSTAQALGGSRSHQASAASQKDSTTMNRMQQSLARSTGGGIGYDLDHATLPTWGSTNANITGTTGIGIPTTLSQTQTAEEEGLIRGIRRYGCQEAKQFIDSFVELQAWLVSLPGEEVVHKNDTKKVKGGTAKARLSSADATTTTAFTKSTSLKSELLPVCFALLAHTYCELMESGMESDARALFDKFGPWYNKHFMNEVRELQRLGGTTTKLVSWNFKVIQHKELHGNNRQLRLKLGALQKEIQQQKAQQQAGPGPTPEANASATTMKAMEGESRALESKIVQSETMETSLRREIVDPYPFIFRLRTSRLPLTASTQAYSMLMSCLGRPTLIPMSVLLMTKCIVEIRPDSGPSATPRTPAVVIASASSSDAGATPTPVVVKSSVDSLHLDVPHPGTMEQTLEEASTKWKQTREQVTTWNSSEVNKAILMNGFRRLEALNAEKVQRDLRLASGNESNNTIGWTKTNKLDNKNTSTMRGNPLQSQSIMMATFADSSSPTDASSGAASIVMQEAGNEITCARFSPDDGRRLAIGSDDSIVRVWNLDRGGCSDNDGKSSNLVSSQYGLSESSIMLIGHKNGWPVFGVDWGRDGRSLLSCSGDGSVRLWDTSAVGSKGTLVKPIKRTQSSLSKKGISAPHLVLSGGADVSVATENGISEIVPGMRGVGKEERSSKAGVEIGGAALSVYYGHSEQTAVWDCKFAPSGYYFASAGSDATARIWTTDQTTPVRCLAGHRASVNCVSWHPNVNYVLTGSDDQTCRLFDVQTGKCVRMLSGFDGWISAIDISPDGRYAATSDSSGAIATYDLAR
jgi:WD40 repeat protein